MTDDVLFHATPVAFDIAAARPLTHFGTFKAAWMRVGEVLDKHGWRYYPDLRNSGRENEMPAFIYPVRLAITRPCLISDDKDILHSPRDIGAMLRKRRILSEDEEASLRCHDPAPILVSLLKAKGYDGLAYENRFEDQGSLSYVVLDASQVTPAGPVLETSLGEILSGALKEKVPPLFPADMDDAASPDAGCTSLAPH